MVQKKEEKPGADYRSKEENAHFSHGFFSFLSSDLREKTKSQLSEWVGESLEWAAWLGLAWLEWVKKKVKVWHGHFAKLLLNFIQSRGLLKGPIHHISLSLSFAHTHTYSHQQDVGLEKNTDMCVAMLSERSSLKILCFILSLILMHTSIIWKYILLPISVPAALSFFFYIYRISFTVFLSSFLFTIFKYLRILQKSKLPQWLGSCVPKLLTSDGYGWFKVCFLFTTLLVTDVLVRIKKAGSRK